MKYGLIGERLGHSFSKEIHEGLADYEYELFELPPDRLSSFIRKRNFEGINLTMPYKESVIRYLDHIDGFAKEIGAVNTVVNRGGILYGYNTDFYGMRELILHSGIELKGKKVAILGSGGTSKTAMSVLKSLGAEDILRVSRTNREGAINYTELSADHSDVDILLNTTPVGMFPNISDSPLDISPLTKLSGVIDTIYNPQSTALLQSAKRRGIKAENGLYMLVLQAYYAAELFLGRAIDHDKIEKIYRKIKAEKENIILVGMPSSGKSTVGRMIAKRCGHPFFDTDEMIEKRISRPIPDYITEVGEGAFRDLESEVIKSLSGITGAVIATGGGAILREENISALKYNGKIYFLDRDPERLIPTADRPLSADREAMDKRYRERYPIYNRVCDVRIDANENADSVAEAILENYL